MSLPLNSSDCLLRITSGEPNATQMLIEGLRLTAWTLRQEEVDVTDGGDRGWYRLLAGAGLRSLELRLAGLYLGSPGEHRLRQLAFNGAAFECELTLEQGSALHGRFIATELSFESSVGEEATYAATLRSSGLIAIN